MLQTLTHQRALRNNPSLSYTGAALHPRCVQTDVFHVSDTNSVHTVFFCCAVTCSRVKAVLCGAWTHRGVVPDVVSAGRTFRAIAFCRLQLWPRVFQEFVQSFGFARWKRVYVFTAVGSKQLGFIINSRGNLRTSRFSHPNP